VTGSPAPAAKAAAGTLAFVLIATAITLTLGALLRAPCAAGDWGDGRQYRRLCYTDIVPLLSSEHLQGNRLPYLNPCPPSAGQCDEYPVLTMYFMRVAAWLSGDRFGSYFWINAFLLAICAMLISLLLVRMVARRALYFALAPTLLIYAYVNWDLWPALLATAATYALLRDREAASGALLGMGAAAKAYPGLLVVPFAADRLHRRDGRPGKERALVVVAWSGIAWVVLNLPFALASRSSWWTFFRFNAERPVDWDSLWFVACTRLHHAGSCSWSPRQVNAASLAAFVAVTAVVWGLRAYRDSGFPRWTLGFPILIAFLLTNKVYSPQYGIWLLPWFALALPSPWLFGLFQAADVAVFVTRFSWFGRLAAETGDPAFAGYHGVTLGGFQVALVIRAAILVACLVAWTVRREEAPVRAEPLLVSREGWRGDSPAAPRRAPDTG
jgi:uncharacterized membrane protein